MEKLFKTKISLVEDGSIREVEVEDFWKKLEVHNRIQVGVLKIEFEGEVFFGQYMQMDNMYTFYPNDPINAERIHIKIGRGNCEKSFPISRCRVTMLDEIEIAILLNLGVGSIGKEDNPFGKHGIRKGTLDKKWWEEKTGQKLI